PVAPAVPPAPVLVVPALPAEPATPGLPVLPPQASMISAKVREPRSPSGRGRVLMRCHNGRNAFFLSDELLPHVQQALSLSPRPRGNRSLSGRDRSMTETCSVGHPMKGGRVVIEQIPVTGVRVGDVLHGKYRIDRVLGMGGAGVVVAGHHLQLAQNVAIKF